MSLTDALLLDPAPFQVWIAYRTDGIKGCGTITDPYDGSSQARFDGAMQEIASQYEEQAVAIHIGPGEFQTKGYPTSGGWEIQPGMRIIGSGIGSTTLQLVSPGTGQNFAISHSLALLTAAGYSEVCDLTIDCNLPATADVVCGAVRIRGDHVRIRRVKARNWGTRNGAAPCFVLCCITGVAGAALSPEEREYKRAGIDDCLVVSPSANNLGVCTALLAGHPDDVTFDVESHGMGPFIRDCFVDCGVEQPDPEAGLYRGLSMSWCRGGTVEGNHVHNADFGVWHQAGRSVDDLIVRNNFFKNVFTKLFCCYFFGVL